jgi:hypothetical protein
MLEQARRAERLAHDLLGLLHRLFRKVLQREAAERQRDAVAQLVAVHIDELERAAAEIADDSVGAIDARHHAERGEPRLARAGQNLDLLAADRFRRRDEFRTVLGVAAGRGRDAPQSLHAGAIAQRTETPQRLERLLDRVAREQAGRLHLAAEPGEDLLVEDRSRRARQAFIDDEADRVGTDVDDGDRMTDVESPLRRKQSARALNSVRGGA